MLILKDMSLINTCFSIPTDDSTLNTQLSFIPKCYWSVFVIININLRDPMSDFLANKKQLQNTQATNLGASDKGFT